MLWFLFYSILFHSVYCIISYCITVSLYHVYAYGLKTVRVKRCFLLPRYFCYGGVGLGGDDDVSCTCTHVRCYATDGVVGWGWWRILSKWIVVQTILYVLFPGVQKPNFLEFVSERNVSSISGTSAFRVFCFLGFKTSRCVVFLLSRFWVCSCYFYSVYVNRDACILIYIPLVGDPFFVDHILELAISVLLCPEVTQWTLHTILNVDWWRFNFFALFEHHDFLRQRWPSSKSTPPISRITQCEKFKFSISWTWYLQHFSSSILTIFSPLFLGHLALFDDTAKSIFVWTSQWICNIQSHVLDTILIYTLCYLLYIIACLYLNKQF